MDLSAPDFGMLGHTIRWNNLFVYLTLLPHQFSTYGRTLAKTNSQKELLFSLGVSVLSKKEFPTIVLFPNSVFLFAKGTPFLK